MPSYREPRATDHRPGEQLGQVGCLLVALYWREQQLDRPLGGQALGLERVRQTQAAHHEVRSRVPAAVELPLDVLALAERGMRGQQCQLLRQDLAVQIRRPGLNDV